MRSKKLHQAYIFLVLQLCIMTAWAQECGIKLSYEVKSVSCYNGSDGAIDIDINGTDNPQIQWDHGPTTEDVYDLQQGIYYVTVSDSSCSVRRSVEVKSPHKPLQMDLLSKKDISCMGEEDGECVIEASGGVPPYQYSINNGATYSSKEKYEKLTDGKYTILAKDFNQCITSLDIQILPATELYANIGKEIQVSSGDSIEISAPEGYSEYQWSTGETTRIILFTRQVEQNSNEYLSVDLTDENGCNTSSNRLKVNIAVFENSQIE